MRELRPSVGDYPSGVIVWFAREFMRSALESVDRARLFPFPKYDERRARARASCSCNRFTRARRETNKSAEEEGDSSVRHFE